VIRCDVFVLSLAGQPSADDLAILDDDERRRAARFVHNLHRWRFIRAHAAVRRRLGHALSRPPEALRFSTSPLGKPSLPGSGLELSLSHSADVALLAIVAGGGPVGVDVERHRQDLDLDAMARTAFSPRERAALSSTAPGERMATFFRIWARKEAFIKAIGAGLQRPLDSFDVSWTRQPAELLATRPDPGEAAAWRMWPLELDDDHGTGLVTTPLVGAVTMHRRET
jgi:4'-phosphopantetheinyl transferase